MITGSVFYKKKKIPHIGKKSHLERQNWNET